MLKNRLVLSLIVVVFLACCQVEAAQISSDWTVCENGIWGDPCNWDPPGIPDNDGNTFAVEIDPMYCELDVGLGQNRTIDQLDFLRWNGADSSVELGAWTPNWVELTLLDPNGLTNYGNLWIDEIGINGNVTNWGMLELSRVEVDANLYNLADATIVAESENDVEGDLENEGELIIIHASDLLCNSNLYNNGQLNLYGGECGVDEILDNNSTGVIRGFGVLYAEQQLQNQGEITAHGGSLAIRTNYLDQNGTLSNTPVSSLQIDTEQDVDNYGIINVNAGGGVAFDCNLVNKSGRTIRLLGGTLAARNITHSAGATLYGFGTITTNELLLESDAEMELTGPTNIIGGVNIDSGATLVITAGQTLIGGHTTNNGTILLAGGTVIFPGGYSGYGETVHATPPFASLVAHWQMDDEAANTLVEDSSGYDNDGTAWQNTVDMWTEGVVDGALSFNGTDDYIDIGSNPIPPSGDWTLAGWVYCEGIFGETKDDYAAAFGSGSWSGSAVQGVHLYVFNSGDLRVALGDGISYAEQTCIPAITSTNANKWYHVAVVYDSTNTEAKVYVDGAYSLTIDRAYAPSTVNFTIGNSLGLNASKSFWYGNIDNVSIFNEMLAEADIEEMYKEVVILAGHWKLDDNTASTVVKDSSYKGNDGTAPQNTNLMSDPGKVGNALSFDGTDDYIDIGANPIPSSADWTLAGWVWCDGPGGTKDDYGTAFGSGSWSGSAVQGVHLYVFNSGDLRIALGDGASYGEQICISNITTTNVNTWYHVAVVYDSTNTEAKVYVDGAYSLTIDRAYAPSNVNFAIGRSLGLNVSKSFWYGKIDNVMIFNEALTDSQIQGLYNE